MNTHTSQAIIMRIKEFGESDLLVTFFTPHKGRLKGLAKGARRSRRRFVNCLDIFCLSVLEYGLNREGGLYFLHSGKLHDAYSGIRSDFTTLSKASYMIELTEILFPWGVADEKMFHLLKESFGSLDKGESIQKASIIFEIKAMTLGGYGINLDVCCMCGREYTGQGMAVYKREKGGIACLRCHKVSAVSPKMEPDTVKMMKAIQSRPSNIMSDSDLTNGMMTEINSVLKIHREYHLGMRPKTADYLE